MIITKVINDNSIGQYAVIIDHSCSIVTSYVNAKLFQYKFDKYEIIAELLAVAPSRDINDFIVDLLCDPEYDSYFEPIEID